MSTSGPRCPNHNVILIMTDTPGIGICPISDCRFQYVPLKDEEDTNPEMEVKIKNGKYVNEKVQKYKIVAGDESKHDYQVR